MPVIGPVKCRLVSARLTPRGGVTSVGQLFLSGLRLFTRRRRGLANELPPTCTLRPHGPALTSGGASLPTQVLAPGPSHLSPELATDSGPGPDCSRCRGQGWQSGRRWQSSRCYSISKHWLYVFG